jgi:hypothetical protein
MSKLSRLSRILSGSTLLLASALAWSASTETAHAFCGFYVGGAGTKLFNNATQVAIMREGTRTVLSMQNNYEGPPQNFAMVVPVPVVLQKENVKTLPKDLFDKLDSLDAPRLVEYWEQDPCYKPKYDSYAYDERSAKSASMAPPAPMQKREVRVEARFSVGEYDIVILSANDSGALNDWLTEQKYAIPAGAEPFFRPYIASGSKFFVAKVNASKVRFEGNQATLSPLRFHYDSESFSLPVRLGLMNAKGPQDLIVHILAQGKRYEVANYPNVTIPTNFNVKEAARKDFGTFYASLYDETVKRHPGAVVTEYSWDASTCDPCPGPPLDEADLMTLGGDAIPNMRDNGGGRGTVLTRLHARYTQESLGDDLVFTAAAPIVGGREHVIDERTGKLERGSVPDAYNNFQGRYAIRHRWEGRVSCSDPHWGVWGGPPGGRDPDARGPVEPVAGKNLAFSKRSMKLTAFNDGEVPAPTFLSAANPTSVSPAGRGAVAANQGGPENAPPPLVPAPRGCGSCATGTGSDYGALGLGLLAVTATLRRLGRKRSAKA